MLEMRDRLNALCGAIRESAELLTGSAADYDGLVDLAGGARFVLIGEASHGTHEFYRERALITRRLIERKGFNAVAAEADWPDAWRVNQFVRGRGSRDHGERPLDGFRRFPNWMWRNTDVLEFVEWLRGHNDALDRERRAGFYGLDLYSLRLSMEAVMEYLERVDPAAARRARYRYSCFEDFGEDPEAYGYAASFDFSQSCEREAVGQLLDMQRHAGDLAGRDGADPAESFFFAEQNARVVKNAEEYYRNMFGSRVSSWNLRDRHMAETLDEIVKHVEARQGTAKIVVWAHNSHLGDARATEMGDQGELNLGQLCRERFGEDVFSIGFTTYAGSVTAASDWGGPAEAMTVRPALAGSFEALFHGIGLPQFFLPLRDAPRMCAELAERRLERAIGVIYRPFTERVSHYFHADLPKQFDAIIHIDRTRAVDPLERAPDRTGAPEFETFPSGV
jgi:erythromycin esterase-like protein